MKKNKFLLITGFLIICHYCLALTVSGFVYVDKNKNGYKDAQEKGLSKIPVSNGVQVVLTDAKGYFSLSVEVGGTVFPIPPSNYQLQGKEPKLPNTAFYLVEKQTLETNAHDFALIPFKPSASFRIAVVGDIQVDDEQEVSYTNRTFMTERLERKDDDFQLVLGDLVNEKPELTPVVQQMLMQLPVPSRTVYGNHDRILKDSVSQDSWYQKYFGSSTYAFNYGNVHFLVFNNVLPKGKKGYEGALTAQQLQFAAKDLQYVPSNHQVVVAMHIPLINTDGRDSLLRLLEPYSDVLFLSGHMHATGRIFHKNAQGKVYQELVAGAVCGSWWTGERDDFGNPSGLMQCGSPRNYYLIDFKQKDYSLKFKAIGLDENRQMGIWIQGQDSIDKQVPALNALPKGTVLANVYAGSDSTVVTLQVDDRPPLRMDQIKAVDPVVSRVITLGKADVYPTAGSKRAALRSTPSPHVWTICLPENLTQGIHTLRIQAKDRFGYEAVQSVSFSIR